MINNDKKHKDGLTNIKRKKSLNRAQTSVLLVSPTPGKTLVYGYMNCSTFKFLKMMIVLKGI